MEGAQRKHRRAICSALYCDRIHSDDYCVKEAAGTSHAPHDPINVYSPAEYRLRSDPRVRFGVHNHSDTGNWLTAWRSTGSTLVYTSFVSRGLECSSNR